MLKGKQPQNKFRKRLMFSMAKVQGVQEEFVYKFTNEEGEEEQVKYLFQHPGVRKGLEIQSSFFNEESGKIDMTQKYDALIKHVIFKGDGRSRVNWDYFEERGIEETNAVLTAAGKFLIG